MRGNIDMALGGKTQSRGSPHYEKKTLKCTCRVLVDAENLNPKGRLGEQFKNVGERHVQLLTRHWAFVDASEKGNTETKGGVKGKY